MRDILAAENRPVLGRFFGANTVLAFDYDGTLAPIVAIPSEAQMRPATRGLLIAVARRFPVAVVTGRARHDVLRFLSGVPLLDVLGNHGFERYGVPPPRVLRQMRDWHRELEERLGSVPGVVIEDKRYSLSIHFRAAANRRIVAEEVRSAAGRLKDARLVGGKCVLNVLLRDAPDKGVALARLRERLGYPPLVFVGDDETDEDVFAGGSGDQFLGIRVGSSEATAAQYCIGEQTDIDELLQRLEAGARERSAARAT